MINAQIVQIRMGKTTFGRIVLTMAASIGSVFDVCRGYARAGTSNSQLYHRESSLLGIISTPLMHRNAQIVQIPW